MSENFEKDTRASWTDTLMIVTGLVIFVLGVVFIFDFLRPGILLGLLWTTCHLLQNMRFFLTRKKSDDEGMKFALVRDAKLIFFQ